MLKPLTIFTKKFILDIWLGFECPSEVIAILGQSNHKDTRARLVEVTPISLFYAGMNPLGTTFVYEWFHVEGSTRTTSTPKNYDWVSIPILISKN